MPAWERENPIKPPAPPPLGMEVFFEDVKPPSPASVRLGRWLFYDTRLSADNTVACASCHKPEFAFSEVTPVSTGIKGQKGGRKAPTFINKAVTLAPYFFWDGRAKSLEDQALGPIANPIEMGNTHEVMIATLSRVQGYKPYFKEAFGTDEITKERVAQAIADYERTRVSGNSPYDRWRFNHEQDCGVGCRETRPRFVLRYRRLRAVPHRQQLQRQPLSQHRRRLGSEDEDLQGRRTLCGHEEARGPRRVQDAGAARRQQARAVHARRIDCDASRSGRAVQQRRYRRTRT